MQDILEQLTSTYYSKFDHLSEKERLALLQIVHKVVIIIDEQLAISPNLNNLSLQDDN